MTTSASDGPSRNLHPGAGNIATGERLLDDKANFIAGAVFAQGGDAGIQVAVQVVCAGEYHHLIGFGKSFCIGAPVAG